MIEKVQFVSYVNSFILTSEENLVKNLALKYRSEK